MSDGFEVVCEWFVANTYQNSDPQTILLHPQEKGTRKSYFHNPDENPNDATVWVQLRLKLLL